MHVVQSRNRHLSYFYINQLFFYEGKDDLVSPFMTEAQSEFNQFREDTLKPKEKLTFATICGDFNFDNMSPSEFLFSFLHIILGSKCESKI